MSGVASVAAARSAGEVWRRAVVGVGRFVDWSGPGVGIAVGLRDLRMGGDMTGGLMGWKLLGDEWRGLTLGRGRKGRKSRGSHSARDVRARRPSNNRWRSKEWHRSGRHRLITEGTFDSQQCEGRLFAAAAGHHGHVRVVSVAMTLRERLCTVDLCLVKALLIAILALQGLVSCTEDQGPTVTHTKDGWTETYADGRVQRYVVKELEPHRQYGGGGVVTRESVPDVDRGYSLCERLADRQIWGLRYGSDFLTWSGDGSTVYFNDGPDVYGVAADGTKVWMVATASPEDPTERRGGKCVGGAGARWGSGRPLPWRRTGGS